MATIWDYLVGSGGDQTLGQTQTAESPMPEYLRDASARNIEAAKGVASEAYTAYGGPRVAGLNAEQQRAIQQQYAQRGQGTAQANVGIGSLGQAGGMYNTAGNMLGVAGGQVQAGMDAANRSRQMAQGGYDATRGTMNMAGGAYGLAGQGAQGITGADIQGFMNPYATNVIDAAARKFTEEGARQQTNLGAKAAMSGGFGGSRAAILSGMQGRSQQEGIGDLYSKGYSNAYQSALAAAQEGRSRQIQGSQAQTQAGGLANQATLARLQAAGQNTAAGSLQNQLAGTQGNLAGQQRQLGDSQRGYGMDQIQAGEARQRIGTQDVRDQLGVAGLQQGVDQRSMDTAYADFLKEQNYPKDQLNFLSGIIGGDPYKGGYSAAPTQYDQPSNFEKVMGYGLQAGNIIKDWWK